jgi:hypothetical protein
LVYNLISPKRSLEEVEAVASRLAGRTVRDFTTAAPVWEILDSWAQQAGYILRGQDQVSRLYQQGSGFWMAPRMLQVNWMGNAYRLQAWVRVPLFNRIVLLGLVPSEVIIDSHGFLVSLPRTKAREQVNVLLQSLGLPPIQ